MIAKTLTFSILGVGLLILGVGIATLSIAAIITGVLAILGCGIFRARVPVWTPNAREESMEIVGAGPSFQQLFPEVETEAEPHGTDELRSPV